MRTAELFDQGWQPESPGSVDYYDVKALSNTAMGYLKKSPLHLWAFLNGLVKETRAMRLGRYIHMALLEPDKWAASFFIKQDGRTKAGKAYNEEMQERGSLGVTQVEYDMMKGIVGRLIQDPFLARLGASGFKAEQDVFWVKEHVECKAKLDVIASNGFFNVLLDIKTTVDASEHKFIRNARAYDYDRQLAWYADAAVQAGLLKPRPDVYILAGEKEAPYAYSIVKVSERTLEGGRQKYKKLFEQFKSIQGSRDMMKGYPPITWDDEPLQESIALEEGLGGLDVAAILQQMAQLQARLQVGDRIGSLKVKTLKA